MAKSTERVVYLNGEIVPESQARVSIFDRGFRWGDGIYEVERTFNGQIFMLKEHIDRMYGSLRYTHIDPGLTKEEMTQAILQVVEANRHLLGPNDDYFAYQVISRGVSDPARRMGVDSRGGGGHATVAISCEPLAFQSYAKFYITGARAITPATRRTPPQCLSPKGKISNKMNHIICMYESHAIDPESFALMLDLDGNVTESHGANFLFVSGGVIKVPNRRNVLPGTTMQALLDLATNIGIPIEENDYTPFDVYQGEEAFLTTGSFTLLPIVSLNGVPIGKGVPGPVAHRLISSFSDLVGLDIVEQALSHIPAEERRALQKGAVPSTP